MKKVKGFSYDTEKHKMIIDHIDNQPNGSQYIWSLVEKDMQQYSLEEIVKRLIEKYLSGVKIKNESSIMDIDSVEISEIINM